MSDRIGISPPGMSQSLIHASHAVSCGPYTFVSGQMGADWRAGRTDEAQLPHVGDPTRAEVRVAFRNLKTIVEAAGANLLDVARVTNYYGHRKVSTGHFAARDEFYDIDPMQKPASTACQTSGLLVDGCTYAVEAFAIEGERDFFVTDRVKASPGRLPMAIRRGDFVFLSGRMATDYENGLAPEARAPEWIWIGSPVRKQTEYILGMHAAILDAAGMSLRDVVKSEVFLRDPADVTVLDEVWEEFFPHDPPARTLYVVDGLAIPDAAIEINHTALHPRSTLKREMITTSDAPAPLFYEPQAVRVGSLLFLSTQVAHDAAGLARDAQPPTGFSRIGSRGRLEAEVILRNIDAICRAAGGSLADVAKVQTHLTDLRQFDAVNEVWKQAFPADPPAWTVAEMTAPRPIRDAVMLCDVVACLPSSDRATA